MRNPTLLFNQNTQVNVYVYTGQQPSATVNILTRPYQSNCQAKPLSIIFCYILMGIVCTVHRQYVCIGRIISVMYVFHWYNEHRGLSYIPVAYVSSHAQKVIHVILKLMPLILTQQLK